MSNFVQEKMHLKARRPLESILERLIINYGRLEKLKRKLIENKLYNLKRTV